MPPHEKLLSAKIYDHDATMRTSDELLDSGSEDGFGGEAVLDSVQEADRAILEEEEDREKLLAKPSRLEKVRQALAANNDKGGPESKRQKRREKRRKRRAERIAKGRNSEDAELMFEMEGGFKDTSSGDTTENEIGPMKWSVHKKTPKRAFYRRIALYHIVIILVFVALAFGAYQASKHRNPSSQKPGSLSNGTHLFGPTTILISLDGFRADFLNRGLSPSLNAFIASGVSPKYMLPSFPSVTFPNHFTLVTGLYPESHGIVGNQFWDPVLQEEFNTENNMSMHPKWWNAEPLWVTAENQGVRTAIHMWPGSEAHIPDKEPTYIDKFNQTEALPKKVDRILGWLDLPGDDDTKENIPKRPQLIAAYVPDVDSDGHMYGPNSTEIRGTIAHVDSMLTSLVEGLAQRNLTEIVNIVIVSDHGMATTATSRVVQVDDIIDFTLVDHVDGWPLCGLRLKNPERDVPIMYEQLMKEAKKSGHFDVYTRETMPERYHFSNNDRIAPLWVVPKTGWVVIDKAHFDLAEAQTIGRQFTPKGLHGYDHEHPLMRAIFVARGPAFPHTPNSRVAEFQNTEVYNIICDSLGINPHPNNGTLRLPFQTQGLHSDPDVTPIETPKDPIDDHQPDTQPDALEDEPQKPAPEPEKPEEPAKPETPKDPEPPVKPEEPEEPETPHASDAPEDEQPKPQTWWEYVHEQLQKAKDWAEEFVDQLKGNKAGKEAQDEQAT